MTVLNVRKYIHNKEEKVSKVLTHMFSFVDLYSPSPELVQLGQSILDLLGCTGWTGDGVPDQLQAALQGTDTRPEVSSTSWR